MIEDIRANLRVENGELIPTAFDATEGSGNLPPFSQRLVSILVGTDREAGDVLRDWAPDAPEDYRGIHLTRRQRKKLQSRRLFLRNRRIVSGYELLDQELRAKLGAGNPDGISPTWLTVGKWTALTIGDLLNGYLQTPATEGWLRRVISYLLQHLAAWRTIPMGRIFVLGNREIFAQVASVLTIFINLDFDGEYGRTYPNFIEEYEQRLLGQFNRDMSDELLFPIRATIRDPLSDSMLRALYAYYRAMGQHGRRERTTWVVIGNLYLAAYEQRIAQTFVEMALALRPERALKNLLGDVPVRNAENIHRARAEGPDERETDNIDEDPGENHETDESGDGHRVRALDMLTEGSFLSRVLDLAAAAFATRFVLSLGVGRKTSHNAPASSGPIRVFAPAYPLAEISNGTINQLLEGTGEAAESLKRVWFALDRAQGEPRRSRVMDWRNYPARISYIVNLFAISLDYSTFLNPVFSESELRNFLSGTALSTKDGVTLTPDQLRMTKTVLERREDSTERRELTAD